MDIEWAKQNLWRCLWQSSLSWLISTFARPLLQNCKKGISLLSVQSPFHFSYGTDFQCLVSFAHFRRSIRCNFLPTETHQKTRSDANVLCCDDSCLAIVSRRRDTEFVCAQNVWGTMEGSWPGLVYGRVAKIFCGVRHSESQMSVFIPRKSCLLHNLGNPNVSRTDNWNGYGLHCNY